SNVNMHMREEEGKSMGERKNEGVVGERLEERGWIAGSWRWRRERCLGGKVTRDFTFRLHVRFQFFYLVANPPKTKD
ncbi:hypothetical protein L195_g062988, partial [Trifolium pratense]